MVVLLDIDGVMIPASGWKVPELLGDGFPAFSVKATLGLRKIISATNASILLTTSHKKRFSEITWKQIFADRGIEADIDKLKSDSMFRTRKDEVMDWVMTEGKNKNYVIIDDDKSLNDLPADIKQKLVLTSSLIGLDDENADAAIAILTRNAHLYRV